MFIKHGLGEYTINYVPFIGFKNDEQLIIVMYNFLGMDLLTITHFLNGFLMIALPILLGIYLTNKFHLGWKLWLIGASTFILSQVVHLPFNSYLLNPLLGTIQQSIPGAPGILLIAIILGLSAGIFEECARYGMFRWWLKDARTWRSSVLAGAGHGGIEAILLGGLVLLGFINMLAYRNSNLSSLNLTTQNLTIFQQELHAYWSLPWYGTLLGAVERIFTIPFHIVASVLVLQVFTRRPGQQLLGWLGLAILWHTIMDATAVFMSSQVSIYVVEAILGGLAILDVIIIFVLRQPEPVHIEPSSYLPPDMPPVFVPKQIEETSENLDKTRYQ